MDIIYPNGIPVTFTRSSSGTTGSKRSNISPRDLSKKRFDIAIIEKKDGEIKVIYGIRATSIIAKAQVKDYEHTLHWPLKIGKRKGADIVVLSDKHGNLSIKQGEEAKKIINEKIIPKGFEVEFIPPKREKKVKNY